MDLGFFSNWFQKLFFSYKTIQVAISQTKIESACNLTGYIYIYNTSEMDWGNSLNPKILTLSLIFFMFFGKMAFRMNWRLWSLKENSWEEEERVRIKIFLRFSGKYEKIRRRRNMQIRVRVLDLKEIESKGRKERSRSHLEFYFILFS